MDIILLENVDKVGEKFDIVTVKNGYARNYLIPQKMALIANSTNMRRLEDYRHREAKREEAMLAVYQDMAKQLEGKTLKIGAKAGTSGKIFGSVTALQIANALRTQLEIDIPRRKVVLPDDVKTIGEYKATLKLHRQVTAEIDFEVVKE
ncbi:MAG: 50S ribosomal protein L9 [Saprospiraceae bacterium]